MTEQRREVFRRQSTHRVQGPHQSQLARHRIGHVHELAGVFDRLFLQFPGCGPLLKHEPRLPHEPVVRVKLKLDQFGIGELRDVALERLRRTVHHAVDATITDVRLLVVVALAGVGPVRDVEAAFRAALHGEAAEPGVVREQEIGRVLGNVRTGRTVEPVAVEAVAVDVAHEDGVAVLGREVVAEVDGSAAVSVAATGFAVLRIPVHARGSRGGPRTAAPVQVVGTTLHEAVGKRVHVVAVHAFHVPAGNDVKHVGDDAVRDEHLAEIVPVEAPRVGRARGVEFEDLLGGVVAPDAAIECDAILVRRARLADASLGLNAVATVKPAVRPPAERVEDVVLRVLDIPPIEYHFGRAVRFVVAVAIGDEHEVGGRAEPDTAEADFDAGEVHAIVEEQSLLLELAVAVGVFEDHDAVAAFAVETPLRVAEALDDPEPPAGVEGHGNRLHEVRLAGEQRDVEALRHGHRLGGFTGRQRAIGELGVCRDQSRAAGENREAEKQFSHGDGVRGWEWVKIMLGVGIDAEFAEFGS